MKKCILKLDLHDDKDKRKALKTVSTLSGIDSITINMKERTLIVVGNVDPINVVSKLRKFWSTHIISVGPAKEPEKKEEGKKDEGKKDDKKDDKKEEEKKGDGKKDEEKKDDTKKKEGGKDEEKKPAPQQIPMGMHMPYRPQQMPVGMHMPYRPYYPQQNIYYNQHQPYQHHYQPHHHSIEENPNACVIC